MWFKKKENIKKIENIYFYVKLQHYNVEMIFTKNVWFFFFPNQKLYFSFIYNIN